MPQLLLDLAPEVLPTFANFVVGSNDEACQHLRTFADTSGFQAIYLWGAIGAGKSHLLHACAATPHSRRDIIRRHAHAPLPDPDTIKPGSLLIIDDVDQLDDTDQTQLFRLFNVARHQHLALLLAAAAPPLSLVLREDLRTRIGQCLILQLHALSDTEKRTALRHHSQQRGMRLDDALLNYLMNHGRRDLHSLFHVLDRLDQTSLEQKRQPTLPLLRELMQAHTQTSS
jgi:DnaA-homolog protein